LKISKKKVTSRKIPNAAPIKITSKTEQGIRKRSLEEIFGKLKKTKQGEHQTFKPGQGDELNPETRPFQFGDTVEQIDFTASIRNAQINHGIDAFSMNEDDLAIRESDYKSQTSTVLMIDISHSMILMVKTALHLQRKWPWRSVNSSPQNIPKDTLDIVVFGNDAWPVEIKDLPYLEVGPVSYKHCCWIRNGHGYFEEKKESEQAGVHDHRWKAYMPENRQSDTIRIASASTARSQPVA
jgi:uncharacterized protein with von Willebrand factor type A (vWA) domain